MPVLVNHERKPHMTTTPTRPAVGALAAIALTTAMDATGLSAFSALVLMPLMALGWRLERFDRRDIGFVWGRRHHHLLAVAYPLLVMGAVAGAAAATGAMDLSATNWHKARINVGLVAFSTVLMAMITEEGFFRGWLWASLRRAGRGEEGTLVLSSVAFSLWHLSAVVLPTGFDLPAAQIPVFMVNAAVMGLGWGLLRALSGSVVVASVSHGLWNGLAYVLFGYGTKVGALGIRETAVYGPEVGVLGLAVNVIVVGGAWWAWRREAARQGSPAAQR